MPLDPTLTRYRTAVTEADSHRMHGRVTNLIGLVIEVTGLRAEVGELVTISAGRNRPPVPAEVVGFREGRTLLMPLGEMHGIGPGTARRGDRQLVPRPRRRRPPGPGARRARAARSTAAPS